MTSIALYNSFDVMQMPKNDYRKMNMVKLLLSIVVVITVVLGFGAAYVLLTQKAPQAEAVVEEIPYDAIHSQN
jgi:hypothetical protein